MSATRLHRIVAAEAVRLNDPDVTARSIRLTEAHQACCATKGIAAAARFLGSSSLDATTEACSTTSGAPTAEPPRLDEAEDFSDE